MWKVFFYVVIFMLQLKFIQGSNFNESLNQNERIEGVIEGHNAREAQFPWVVSLIDKSARKHFCAGTIIRSNWVLTAAHCLLTKVIMNEKLNNSVTTLQRKINLSRVNETENDAKVKELDPNNLVVVAGTIYNDDPLNYLKKGRVEKDVCYLKVYEGYKKSFPHYIRHDADIGLLQTTSNFNFLDKHVKQLPFINYRRAPKILQKCYITGWGFTVNVQEIVELRALVPKKNLTQILQYVDVFIQNLTECNTKMNERFNTSNWPKKTICARPREGEKNSCHGDSGGPLVCEGELVGITAASLQCDIPNFPGAFANVFHYSAWIHKIVKKKECTKLGERHFKLKPANPAANKLPNLFITCFLFGISFL